MDNEIQNDAQILDPEVSVAVLRKRKEHTEKRLQGFQFRIWILITTVIAGGFIGYAFMAIIKSEKRKSLIHYLLFLHT